MEKGNEQMSWIQTLYDTYENCKSEIGVIKEGKIPLLPLFHTLQQAQIEAVIDTEGRWCPGRAVVLTDKKDMVTIIPCTEKSAIRTSGPEPHPLFDKLKYIAGDYGTYWDEKISCYKDYIAQLSDWCASPYAHPKVSAVLKYLKKGTLIRDLIADQILYADESGRLLSKWLEEEEETPPIFKVCAKDQADAFVRFQVIPADGSEDAHCRLWEDKSVWKSYMDFQASQPAACEVCYVRGEKLPVAVSSPKFIRRPGDGAKLISGNDSSGFTFRGRFSDAGQALCIGRETTEKAHSALKWLISRQAYINGDQVVLAFGTNGEKIPDPCSSALDLLLGTQPETPLVSTKEEFAARLRKAIAGYGCNLKDGEKAVVLGLDSATPGRLSIFYYRETRAADFLHRIESWHKTCSWQLYDFKRAPSDQSTKAKTVMVPYVGAPSPKEIADAAYGRNAGDKLKKNTVERLLPCIIDGARLPADLMHSAARRASNPIAIEAWEQPKILGVACALIRKYYNDKANHKQMKDPTYKEVWKMGLDTNENNREYLFGRALAYAQQIEGFALSLGEDKRVTNAERLQTAFSQHPAKTWMVLDRQLRPYYQRLGVRANHYREEMNEVLSRIPREEFSNKPLSELYLLGYACQMQQFQDEKKERMNQKNKLENINEGE